ncbi:MAG: hypothetical protein D6731_25180 [Planctomycetota bacterium]|nr:MAG: hypothetical protein D6731_25180 [Planctomycetota bacterium]
MRVLPLWASALLLGGALYAGCSGSGGSGGAAAVAPSAAPDPGGAVAAPPGTASTAAVGATLETDAYTAFRENVSISSFAVPDVPGLRERAFVVEDDGTVRVLDLTGTAPVLDRALSLLPTPLAAGTATGAIRVQSESLALVTTSGSGAEGVALFDPTLAQSAGDVTWYDLSSETVTWPAGTLDSAGIDVGGQALPKNFTADAAVVGGKLYVASSNFDTSTFANRPGTVTAWAIDLVTRQRYGQTTLPTRDFNPTGLTVVDTPQGSVLLVTNTGVYGGNAASIDVIDPDRAVLVGTLRFPSTQPTNPTGRVVVSPDGRRGYVGSQSAAEVYVLDLEGIGQALANQSPQDLSARFLGGYVLPSQATTNFVSDLALSHTGNYLYAVSFNESALYVIDLLSEGIAAEVRGFARTGTPANFEGLLNSIEVRPGVPGRDYAGASILGVTINLAAADRTLANVSVALDRVSVDRH